MISNTIDKALGQHVRLSYDITLDTPGWPGNPGYTFRQLNSIEAGDVANTFDILLFNHFGTHLDAPAHFNPMGPRIAEVPIDRFLYRRPLLLDIPKGESELVTVADLRPYEDRLRDSDLVLIRSGWGRLRSRFPRRYAADGPGVSPDACEYLLLSFPDLKAIGMDWISLAAYRKFDPEGIEAHQILCGARTPGRYMIIIEDINLAAAPERLKRMYAIPLFLEGVDSSPCTIVAEGE